MNIQERLQQLHEKIAKLKSKDEFTRATAVNIRALENERRILQRHASLSEG